MTPNYLSCWWRRCLRCKAMITLTLGNDPCSNVSVLWVLEGGFGFVPGARGRLWTQFTWHRCRFRRKPFFSYVIHHKFFKQFVVCFRNLLYWFFDVMHRVVRCCCICVRKHCLIRIWCFLLCTGSYVQWIAFKAFAPCIQVKHSIISCVDWGDWNYVVFIVTHLSRPLSSKLCWCMMGLLAILLCKLKIIMVAYRDIVEVEGVLTFLFKKHERESQLNFGQDCCTLWGVKKIFRRSCKQVQNWVTTSNFATTYEPNQHVSMFLEVSRFMFSSAINVALACTACLVWNENLSLFLDCLHVNLSYASWLCLLDLIVGRLYRLFFYWSR